MDFRLPQYRREVFLRFYEFHTRFNAHPGGVYYLIPHLQFHLDIDEESMLWWAFLNGNTQNPITTTILFNKFPRLQDTESTDVKAFLDQYWKELEFDSDRRYWKKELPNAILKYQKNLSGETQASYFRKFTQAENPASNFNMLWNEIRTNFHGFGRLSSWSYMEYLWILGLPIDPGTLFLEDRDGSKSLRNGLCKVLGRDDLDWHDSNPGFDGKYSKELIAQLNHEANLLMKEARERIWPGKVGFFTLESTFCSYKSWHRPNRRYPNVYNDMMNLRIKRAEQMWNGNCPVDLDKFWEARRIYLPKYLRLEDNPNDLGLHPTKQNHYRTTGQVIMMDREWPCFANDYAARLEP